MLQSFDIRYCMLNYVLVNEFWKQVTFFEFCKKNIVLHESGNQRTRLRSSTDFTLNKRTGMLKIRIASWEILK